MGSRIINKENNKSILPKPVPEVDNISVQLDSIKQVQDQGDFLNNKEVLRDFEIFFKVRLRRSEI